MTAPVVRSICVCGAGTMGSGIAQVAAQAGYHTILYDLQQSMVAKAMAAITSSLDASVTKNKITGNDRSEILSRVRPTTDLNDCIADVFIEAIVEKTAAKTALFNQLNEVNHAEVIFATNTSSLSISDIAQHVMHPARVIGMHFFNPAPIMKLVEVVRGQQTDDATTALVLELARNMGKTPVLCLDRPGFIVNHVARPYYLEALRLMEAGVPPETIDALMEASGFKMGPFRLMDFIGNDINYAVSCSLYEAMEKPSRLQPSPLQKEKVDKGELGKKTGKGFYNY